MKVRGIPRTMIAALSAAALALVLFVAVVPCAVLAHRPIIEDRDTSGYGDPIYVPDSAVSWARYGFLGSQDDVDYYAFDVTEPQDVSVSILVPVRYVYRDFRPSLAILGPGINSTMPVPFDVPRSTGAHVISMPADSETFYEPFGGVNYWRSPVSHIWLDRPGRYYVVVFDRMHARGDYVLAIGEKESFPLSDIPGILWTTLRIRACVWDHSKTVSGAR
jgi:hypothetical protein